VNDKFTETEARPVLGCSSRCSWTGCRLAWPLFPRLEGCRRNGTTM